MLIECKDNFSHEMLPDGAAWGGSLGKGLFTSLVLDIGSVWGGEGDL